VLNSNNPKQIINHKLTTMSHYSGCKIHTSTKGLTYRICSSCSVSPSRLMNHRSISYLQHQLQVNTPSPCVFKPSQQLEPLLGPIFFNISDEDQRGLYYQFRIKILKDIHGFSETKS
jgi:hypothetical protein